MTLRDRDLLDRSLLPARTLRSPLVDQGSLEKICDAKELAQHAVVVSEVRAGSSEECPFEDLARDLAGVHAALVGLCVKPLVCVWVKAKGERKASDHGASRKPKADLVFKVDLYVSAVINRENLIISAYLHA